MEFLIYALVASVASLCFALIFNVSKHLLMISMLIGTSTACLYHFLSSNLPLAFSTFASAFYIGTLGHLISRRYSVASQPFIVPGLIFLVPGTNIYKSLNFAMLNLQDKALGEFLSAVIITSSISFSLLLASWVVPKRSVF